MTAPAYKVLGQKCPANTSVNTLLTVPGGHEYVVSTIAVCNRTGANAKATINIRPGGATLTNDHVFVYQVTVVTGTTQTYTLGFGLAATDVIDCQSDTSNALVFHAFGTDIS